MDRSVLMAIVIVFMLFLLGLMFWAWRGRKRRQASVARPQTPPTVRGELAGTFAGKYVATTAQGAPLDRIAVHGLGFRGFATVSVFGEGILVQIAGTPEIWIPAVGLTDIRRATWTIDRVVEQDGLQLLEWKLGEQTVDTYLRMDSPAAFETAAHTLISAPAATTERHTS
ncbi:MAG: hypothetical protein ACOH19_08285 [Rhodoglobus sp.]